jgi:hypothetical protein
MRLIVSVFGLTLAFLPAVCAAEEENAVASDSSVRTAGFEGTGQKSSRQRVTFAKRAPRVGDEVEQSLGLQMQMVTTMRQGNQLGEKSRTSARNELRRVVSTTHVEAGQTVAVRVQYLEATKQVNASKGGPSLQTPGDGPEKKAQPVAGKTYLCQRLPGKDGGLNITDEAGHIPPTDEYEIVAQQMEMVGRPNPLAEFLAGRSIAVGETIELPREVAGKIFNLGEQFGDIAKFDLKLNEVSSAEGHTRAEFVARVEAASNNASQMRMQMEGPLVVEVDTCRALNLNLSGPIAMSETRGSYSMSYQAIGTGTLKTHIASTFRDAGDCKPPAEPGAAGDIDRR